MNYNLRRAATIALGRALLVVSRRLARAGARLVGHPSAQAERVVQRPPLRVVGGQR